MWHIYYISYIFLGLKLHFTVCTRFVVNKHMRHRLLPLLLPLLLLLLLLFVALTVICYLRQRFVHIGHIIMQTALNCKTQKPEPRSEVAVAIQLKANANVYTIIWFDVQPDQGAIYKRIVSRHRHRLCTEKKAQILKDLKLGK